MSVAMLLGVVGGPGAEALTLTPMIDLGTLGGIHSESHAVSGTVVVGSSSISGNAEIHAFVYDLAASSPHMVDLGTLGGTYSDAAGVSGDIVVGSSTVAGSDLTHAFAYDLAAPSPHMVDLGTLGGTSSAAHAVSGSIIVGSAALAGDPQVSHAFAYDLAAPSPHMVDLGTLGGTSSVAAAVSGSLIVGNAQLPGDPYFEPFAYDLSAASPQMVDLGTLGGTNATAAGVGGSIVVGWTKNMKSPFPHAFAYDLAAASPKSIDLGTFPGGSSSGATGVSGSVVVGGATVSDYKNDHPFAYDLSAPSPRMNDLGTLGGTSAFASGVSGNIVVGSSQLAGSATVHAFAYDLAAPALLPQITSVSPRAFSPNHDGHSDSTAFRVHLPKAESVSFVIRNSNGQTIRGPHTPGLRSAGLHTYVWDGKTNRARIASDGLYTIVVTTSVKSGKVTLHLTATATVRLDNTPPKLSRMTGNGTTFYPFCSRCGNTKFRPKVNVNESGRLWLVITAGHEKLVVAQPHASTGPFQLTWNGRDHEGRVVPPGAYKYYFTALDPAENRRTSATYVVHVSHKRSP